MSMAHVAPTPFTDSSAWFAPITDTGATRHEARLARILQLSDALGTPASVSYLDSCEVRELPLILARLQARYMCRRR